MIRISNHPFHPFSYPLAITITSSSLCTVFNYIRPFSLVVFAFESVGLRNITLNLNINCYFTVFIKTQ